MANENTISLKQFLFVQFSVIIYSFCGVFQKYAAQREPLSLSFLFFYACSIGILFVYAFLWQIVLKKIPLTMAYSNRAVAMIWTLVWSAILFREAIGWKRIIGAVIICVGVFFVTTDGRGENHE